MGFKDHRELISALEKIGEVQRIEQEVDWNLEIGAIQRKVYEEQGPMLFFQRIKGYPEGYRMCSGGLSTMSRIAVCFGLDPKTPPKVIMDEYSNRIAHPIPPRIVKDGPCKENIQLGDDINLFQFPAPMLHDGDGGRYLCTWHLTVTKDLESDWMNWGMYRAMIHNRSSLVGLISIYQHIGHLWHRGYVTRNQPMPFAIAIAPPPVCAFVACSRLPFGTDEADIAGGLQGEPIDVVKCETNDLFVPATSEIVIEGEIHPNDLAWEGPFGEYTGYRASPRDRRPVYRVKAVTYRSSPILTFSCMGVPVDESDAVTAISRSADVLELLRRAGIPGIVDAWMPPESSSNLQIVSVKVPFHGIAYEIGSTILGSELGRSIGYVMVVDPDVDIRNMDEVVHTLVTKCHPYRGIHKVEHAFGSVLAPFLSREERLGYKGAKAIFDCTWPIDWDPSIAVPPKASFASIYPKEVQEHVLKNWKNYGFKQSQRADRSVG